ncbi:MAG: CtsR family transcriptional regulator [Clostridiales bacterium]|nr:CtsR family transcriptional regulator [Clostridiales bacterium]
MSAISDTIERFILELMGDDKNVEIQRNELAEYFSCAPSQINYVLATRFNMNRGYMIESKRGGGGYIRVFRIGGDENDICRLAWEQIGQSITASQARDIISLLRSAGAFTDRELRLMLAAVSDEAIRVPASVKNKVRADILKNMLLQGMRPE